MENLNRVENKIYYANEIQVGNTTFTVNNIQSETAKKDVKSIVKGLILSNLNTN